MTSPAPAPSPAASAAAPASPTRRHGLILLAVAAWNVLTYATFTRNLAQAYADGEDRPTGYWVAHSVLIVVNLLIAAVLARLGLRFWRDARGSR